MPKKSSSSRGKRTPEVQAERDRTIPRPSPESGLRVASPNEWLQIWHEVRVKPPVKVIGYALLKFADFWDGADIRPGEPLLAVRTDQSERTVGKALGQMREWGLIWRYVRGSSQGRKKLVDVYRLTIPADLSARVPFVAAVASLPDHPNEVPVIVSEQANDVRVIGADHPNLTTGSPEPRDMDHPNEVRPTFTSDLSTTSPGVLYSLADVEVGPATDERDQILANFRRLPTARSDVPDLRPAATPYQELYRDPECEHGVPGGILPIPRTGQPRCALCRLAASSRESA